MKTIVAFITGVACSLNETFVLPYFHQNYLMLTGGEFQGIFPFLVYGKGFLSALFRHYMAFISKLMHDFTN